MYTLCISILAPFLFTGCIQNVYRFPKFGSGLECIPNVYMVANHLHMAESVFKDTGTFIE